VVTLAVVGVLIAAVVGLWFGARGVLGLATKPLDDTVPHTAEVGECYRMGNAAMTPVRCDELHHFEVISVEFLPATADYPAFWQRVNGTDVCTAAFRSWTGMDWLDTEMGPGLAVPSESQWAQGERRTACALHLDDFGPMFESARVG
jgi:hypothetical protein